MTIRNKIIKDLKESFFPKFSDIAEKHGTSRYYVMDIYNQIHKENKTIEIDAPKFWNPEDELKQYYANK